MAGLGGDGDGLGYSPEELTAMLRQYEAMTATGAAPRVPELESLMKAVKSGASPTVPAAPSASEDILPDAGFVVKTRLLNSTDPQGESKKVFVNICGSARVPAPGDWKSGVPEEVEKAIRELEEGGGEEGGEVVAKESVRFPLSMSEAREDVDHSGEPSVVYDVVFNSDVLRQAMVLRQLKLFIIDMALQWLQQKHSIQLDPKYRLPRLAYKGTPVPHKIRAEQRALISEIAGQRDDDPSLPLRLKPKAKPVHAQAEAGISETKRLKQQKDKEKEKERVPPMPQPPPQNDDRPKAVQDRLNITGARETATAKLAPKRPPSPSLPQPEHSVEFEGVPAVAVVVMAKLSKLEKASEVRVAVEVEELSIQPSHSYGPLTVALPFAVDARSAVATFRPKDGSLRLYLPYRPFSDVVDEMKQSAPHALGSLELSDRSFLDID
eukprot:jgi/Chlat1/2429/Chrsp17S02826